MSEYTLFILVCEGNWLFLINFLSLLIKIASKTYTCDSCYVYKSNQCIILRALRWFNFPLDEDLYISCLKFFNFVFELSSFNSYRGAYLTFMGVFSLK